MSSSVARMLLLNHSRAGRNSRTALRTIRNQEDGAESEVARLNIISGWGQRLKCHSSMCDGGNVRAVVCMEYSILRTCSAKHVLCSTRY